MSNKIPKIFYEELSFEDLKKSEEVKKLFSSHQKDVEKFCIIPFSNIILEPDGKVGMCRQKGSDFPIGNIKKNTIAEIWNNEKAQKWRREFLEEKPKKCKENIAHTHCNLCHSNNDHWQYVELSEIQTKPIIKLTANLNGKCNLQCNMCHIWRKPNDIYNEENFWIPAKKDIFPYLKELEMLSGEPFIQKDTFRLIEEVSSVNPDCEWSITTNGHYQLGDFHKKLLDKIKLKNLLISVDSINESTYSIIRYPGNVNTVLKTIDDFLDYNKTRSEKIGKINIRLNFLIVKENWQELESMLDFCAQKKIHPFIAFCYMPQENSLLTLSYEERLKILNFYLDTINWQKLQYSMRVIKPLLDGLKKIDKVECLLKLQKLKADNKT